MNLIILYFVTCSMFLSFQCLGASENQDSSDKSSLSLDQVISEPPDFEKDYRDQALRLFTQKNHEAPYSDFNKTLAPNFKDDNGHWSLGMQYFREMDIKNAIDEFDKVIEINPKNPQVFYYRGVSLILNDDFQKGWEGIRKAQELGFKVNPKMLNSLKKYTSRFDRSKLSPDVEKSFKKLQWGL